MSFSLYTLAILYIQVWLTTISLNAALASQNTRHPSSKYKLPFKSNYTVYSKRSTLPWDINQQGKNVYKM